MAIEFRIDGLLEMRIFEMHRDIEMSEDFQQGILDNLQQGEYVIGFKTKEIYDINDLETPLYRFELSPTDDIEYMFDNAVIV